MSLIDSFNDGTSAITFPVRKFGKANPLKLCLISDIHLIARSCNEDAVRRLLDRAVDEARRILINGDLIDGIFPKDFKRYVPSVVMAAMSGRDDLLNSTVQYAIDFLTPYKEYIDFIGVGNHELSVLQYHSYDVMRPICQGLSTTAHKVKQGQYMGFLRYPLSATSTQVHNYDIYYTHGAGGASPVTKGMIEFNRILSGVQNVNMVWAGHMHTTTWTAENRLSMNQVGEVKNTIVDAVRTAGFLGHKEGSYPARFGMRPQPLGGMMIDVKWGSIVRKGQPRREGVVSVECTPIIIR